MKYSYIPRLWVNISASDEAGYHRHKRRYNGITSTSEAAGYELDGAGFTISGRLCNSIKIREV